jgi:hypothetical protein
MPQTLRVPSMIAAGAAATLMSSAASSAIIAGWSIPTAFPTGTGVPTGVFYSVGVADQGDQTAGSQLSSVHALAAATYTSPAGNGSQYSFSSNNWSIGDYYEARLSTSNYTDISLSWDQARSSTGPSTFELIFSVDGGVSWTTAIASYAVLQSGGGGSPGTWSTSIYNSLYTSVTGLAGAEDAAELLIRFRATVAAGGSSGSNRIDNVVVSGTLIPAPGAIALLGAAGLIGGTRRRR